MMKLALSLGAFVLSVTAAMAEGMPVNADAQMIQIGKRPRAANHQSMVLKIFE
jgi:hypothetical protein